MDRKRLKGAAEPHLLRCSMQLDGEHMYADQSISSLNSWLVPLRDALKYVARRCKMGGSFVHAVRGLLALCKSISGTC